MDPSHPTLDWQGSSVGCSGAGLLGLSVAGHKPCTVQAVRQGLHGSIAVTVTQPDGQAPPAWPAVLHTIVSKQHPTEKPCSRNAFIPDIHVQF